MAQQLQESADTLAGISFPPTSEAPRIPLVVFGLSLGLFLAITYVLCVGFDLIFPGQAMYRPGCVCCQVLLARLEHRAILESLTEIAALAPGLYEMKIDNPSGDPDCHKPAFSVRFEERQVEDLKFVTPSAAFESVRQVSEVNEWLYTTFVSPFVRAFANPWSAAMLEWLHPMRTSRYLLSERFSPWMRGVAALARMIEKDRATLPQDNPSIARERAAEQVAKTIEQAREHRDAAEEQRFALLYGVAPLEHRASVNAGKVAEKGYAPLCEVPAT